MSLRVRAAFSDGLSLVRSRNGLLFAAVLLTVNVLGGSVVYGAIKSALPTGSPGLFPETSSPSLAPEASQQLPTWAEFWTALIGAVVMSVFILPILIVAARVFLAEHRDVVPDDLLFDDLERATARAIGLALLVLGLVCCYLGLVGGALFGLLQLLDAVEGVAALAALLAIVLLFFAVPLGILYIFVTVSLGLFEVASRDTGQTEALRRSISLTSGNRLGLLKLGLPIVLGSWLAQWLLREVGTALGTGLLGPAGGAVIGPLRDLLLLAVFAAAYRQLESEDPEELDDRVSVTPETDPSAVS